jgi:hypothetical protein
MGRQAMHRSLRTGHVHPVRWLTPLQRVLLCGRAVADNPLTVPLSVRTDAACRYTIIGVESADLECRRRYTGSWVRTVPG